MSNNRFNKKLRDILLNDIHIKIEEFKSEFSREPYGLLIHSELYPHIIKFLKYKMMSVYQTNYIPHGMFFLIPDAHPILVKKELECKDTIIN